MLGGINKMYTSGYNKLFWGMIFVAFDINLGPLSVLPNFIGYMFIYSGLNTLAFQQREYEKGKIPAIILILLTLKDLWHNESNNILTGPIQNSGLITMIISGIVAVINLYLIYIICEGIYELCKELELKTLMDSTLATWKFYFGIGLIGLIYIPFSINLPLDYNMFMIIVGLFQVVASISIMMLFRKCKVELCQGEGVIDN